MNEMSDKEFLLYCRTHCNTPRAAFVPSQIARLYRLAGFNERATIWNRLPNQILDGHTYIVLDLLDKIEKRGQNNDQ